MNDEELYNWFRENFEARVDEHMIKQNGRVDVDLMPKTEIGEMLDIEFGQLFRMHINGRTKFLVGFPIWDFLKKFYNIKDGQIEMVSRKIYDEIWKDYYR
jgi:hypothetical protein